LTAPARAEVRAVVRYRDNARMVTFDNVGLARAVEALQAEDPPYECGPDLDAPPGRYVVRSRSAQREGRTAYWYICLDPERGTPVAAHNCRARAANPRNDIQCRHMAAAWLAWKAERDEQDPWLRRVRMSESTALVPAEEQRALTPYYLPNERDIKDTLALATTLMTTRGSVIPAALDTAAKVAAVVIAGRELGFDPMTSMRRLYLVNGQTQLDGQGIVAKIQAAGGDVVYHETTDAVADVEVLRPGRAPVRVRYTMEQAIKAGSTKNKYGEKETWRAHPGDMLIWKAVTRAGKRGAADLINALESAMVRVDDLGDYTGRVGLAEVREQLPTALTDGGVDTETGEIAAPSEPVPPDDVIDAEATVGSQEPVEPPDDHEAPPVAGWESVAYADAQANKSHYFKELSAFQKALGRRLMPDGYEDLRLGEICAQSIERSK